MNFQKKHLLVVIGIACLALAYYSFNKQDKDDKTLSFTEWLPAIGGGAYAINFLVNLAK